MTGTALTVVDVKKHVSAMHTKGELPLPSNVSLEAFTNAATVAITDNPDILQCDAGSVFKSIRKIAGMGLVPDGHEAAIVPYNTKQGGSYVKLAQAIPMVAGLIKRARNSGEISSLWAEVVYEGEELKVWIDNGERRWEHTFNPLMRSGEIIGAYAVAKLKDGTIEFEPMPRAEIDKIRNVSKAKDGPAWRDWFSEMAKKTVIRRLCKRLPMSTDDKKRIIESDSDTIGEMKDITPPRTLQEKLNAARTKTAEEAPQETPPHDAETGEIIEAPNPDNAFPGSAEFEEGEKAAQDGQGFNDNPYAGGQKADDWAGGWLKAKDAEPAEQEQDG